MKKTAEEENLKSQHYRHDRYRVGDTWYTTVSSTIGPKSYISVRSLLQGRGKIIIICSSRIEDKKRNK